MIIICINIPAESLESVTTAMFTAGAGRTAKYDQCCFVTNGTGQFRPLAGSDPFIGTQNQLTKVAEYKVETICSEENYAAVVKAMLEAHPYEEPYWYRMNVEGDL